jgi:hypothetical protein
MASKNDEQDRDCGDGITPGYGRWRGLGEVLCLGCRAPFEHPPHAFTMRIPRALCVLVIALLVCTRVVGVAGPGGKSAPGVRLHPRIHTLAGSIHKAIASKLDHETCGMLAVASAMVPLFSGEFLGVPCCAIGVCWSAGSLMERLLSF